MQSTSSNTLGASEKGNAKILQSTPASLAALFHLCYQQAS